MIDRSEFILCTVATIASVFLSGCGKPATEEGDADVAEGKEERVFHVRGVVQAAMDDPHMMLIDHEEIPGFMPRMIMPFRVLDAEEFEGLQPGMAVTLDFHVKEHESWATNIQKTGESGPITLEKSSTDTKGLLGLGDQLPDYGFVDETGKSVRLSDYRGAPVALTFVFSRCPIPEYCPRMMNHFSTVRESLESDPTAPDNFQLLTISFDSEHDTPEVMKKWAAAYGHQSGQPWSLLSTPDESTIENVAGNVGLRFGEVNGTLQHNLRTLVLDSEGTIRALFTDETWSAEELVEEIKKASST